MPALRALFAQGYQLVAAYTQPDRPAGRGREAKASALKQAALELGIPVYQPVSLKDPSAQAQLAVLKPDLMVVAAYGLLLPQAVLDVPRLGCINIHASLVPRWRGAAPIQRAILAGDTDTGISIMQMDAGLDTGAVLAQAGCAIHDTDTGSNLHDRLMALGAQTLLNMLPAFLAGTIIPVAQQHQAACYAAKLNKHEASIDWTQSAQHLARCVRAFNAWPVAYTQWHKHGKGDTLRIWQAQALAATSAAAPGTVLTASAEGIDVATGDGVLRLLAVQTSGKRALGAADFVNANSLQGQRLGTW